MDGGHVRWSLEPAGPVAEDMEWLWWLMFWVGTAVFVLFLVLLLAGLVTKARTEPGDDRRSVRRWIVLGGVVLPTLVLAVVLGATLAVMRATPTPGDAAAQEATVVEVTGHRWWYEVHYPEADVTVRDELHLPVGSPVLVRVTSSDVIHSFWVPELGGKIDMLPDDVNEMVLVADRAGVFTARCAEFCGLHHTDMKLRVVAESEERFSEWVAEQE
jgi:cytochrome c oxidase subunit II